MKKFRLLQRIGKKEEVKLLVLVERLDLKNYKLINLNRLVEIKNKQVIDMLETIGHQDQVNMKPIGMN